MTRSLARCYSEAHWRSLSTRHAPSPYSNPERRVRTSRSASPDTAGQFPGSWPGLCADTGHDRGTHGNRPRRTHRRSPPPVSSGAALAAFQARTDPGNATGHRPGQPGRRPSRGAPVIPRLPTPSNPRDCAPATAHPSSTLALFDHPGRPPSTSLAPHRNRTRGRTTNGTPAARQQDLCGCPQTQHRSTAYRNNASRAQPATKCTGHSRQPAPCRHPTINDSDRSRPHRTQASKSSADPTPSSRGRCTAPVRSTTCLAPGVWRPPHPPHRSAQQPAPGLPLSGRTAATAGDRHCLAEHRRERPCLRCVGPSQQWTRRPRRSSRRRGPPLDIPPGLSSRHGSGHHGPQAVPVRAGTQVKRDTVFGRPSVVVAPQQNRRSCVDPETG